MTEPLPDKRSARQKAKAEKAGDDLCKAVAAWVKALGGKPMVVGGIGVAPDRKYRFEVVVRVTGLPPDLKKFGRRVA